MLVAFVVGQELRGGKCHQPETRNHRPDGQDPSPGSVLIGMQRPLLPGKKSVTEKPDPKKNNADNESNYCHGQTIYSLSVTIGKWSDCLVQTQGLIRTDAIHWWGIIHFEDHE